MAKIRIPLDYKQRTDRAMHDLSKVVRTTLHTGLDTPVYVRRLFPGDDIRFQIESYKVQAQSTVFPVLGNFRVRHEIFFEPDSNLYGWIQNNDKKPDNFLIDVARKNQFNFPYTIEQLKDVMALIPEDSARIIDKNIVGASTGEVSLIQYLSEIDAHILRSGSISSALPDVPFDMFSLSNANSGILKHYYNQVWNVRPGSLFEHLGIPSGYIPDNSESNQYMVLDYVLAYLDYWRSYHRNTQQANIPFCRGLQPNREFVTDNNGDTFKFYDDSFLDYGNILQKVPTSVDSGGYRTPEHFAFVANANANNMLDDLFRFLHYTTNGIVLNLETMYGSLPFDGASDTPSMTNLSSSTIGNRYKPINALCGYLRYCHKESGGLMPSTYMPDLYRNLLASDTSDMTSKVEVKTDENGNQYISIEDFRMSNRIQLILERFKVSGGRFVNWMLTLFGIKPRRRLDIPYLIGVLTDYIGTTTVTSTASTDGADLGQMAAKVDQTRGSNHTHRFVADEKGILMCIVSIVPEVDYFQGLKPYMRDLTFIDEWLPQMSNKGFEDIPVSEYVGIAPENVGKTYEHNANRVVGQQVAWLREMTDVNELHGEFSTNGLYQGWVLGRRYQRDTDSYLGYVEVIRKKVNPDTQQPIISLSPIQLKSTQIDLSTYVDPLDWQYLFQLVDLGTPNWYYQAKFNVKAIRPIGRRFMPTLE